MMRRLGVASENLRHACGRFAGDICVHRSSARGRWGDDFRAGSLPHPLTWLRRPDAAVGDGAVVAVRVGGPVGRIDANGSRFPLEARCA
jgi:hypothetical protein